MFGCKKTSEINQSTVNTLQDVCKSPQFTTIVVFCYFLITASIQISHVQPVGLQLFVLDSFFGLLCLTTGNIQWELPLYSYSLAVIVSSIQDYWPQADFKAQL